MARRINPLIVAEDYRGGMTVHEIAEWYGISERTVRRHLKSEGVNVRKRTIGERLQQAIDRSKRSPDAQQPM